MEICKKIIISTIGGAVVANQYNLNLVRLLSFQSAVGNAVSHSTQIWFVGGEQMALFSLKGKTPNQIHPYLSLNKIIQAKFTWPPRRRAQAL